MDISVNEKGAMDFGKLSENLESTIMNTDLVLSHLTDTETFGFKITLISAIGISLYVLLKITTKKRLHRKGVEHGSARWSA